MGKLILEMQLSLDGFVAAEDGNTDWMIWNWGPQWKWDKALQDYHTTVTRSASRILLSSQMAQEGFIGHWQQVAAGQDAQQAFASHIAHTPKVVVSKHLTKDTPIPGGWEQVEIVKDLEAVRRLKTERNGSIIVYGGASLVASLLRQQLIDEMHFLVNPVALGNGLRIFNDLTHLVLVQATGFACGVTALHYRLQ